METWAENKYDIPNGVPIAMELKTSKDEAEEARPPVVVQQVQNCTLIPVSNYSEEEKTIEANEPIENYHIPESITSFEWIENDEETPKPQSTEVDLESDLLDDFQDIIARPGQRPGTSLKVEHKIDTGQNPPIRTRPYPIPRDGRVKWKNN